jgi:hypothetical protein
MTKIQLYPLNSAEFYEQVSVRTVFAVNSVRNSMARNNRVQKTANF